MMLTQLNKWTNRLLSHIIPDMIAGFRNLGASLLVFSGVLLGFGFQSYYAWNLCGIGITLWILTSILFLSGLSLSITSIVMARRKEKESEKIY